MQSTENVIVAESSDKSLTEWPTLGDVFKNKKTFCENSSAVKNGRNIKKSSKARENSGGYESSKENDMLSQCSNGRGARKKTSAKTKWVPVPIVPQPYKKRGNGRHFYDSNSGADYDRRNEDQNDHENGRSNVRGNSRFRGKRGRGYSHSWRSNRDITSRGASEENSTDLAFDPNLIYPSTTYYDPFMHSMYASALRDKELKKAIRQQIEYYFSDDNLVTDIFMRRKMDSQGYVPLTLISTFNRVRNLTKSLDQIIEALKESSKLELADDGKVRPVIDPLKWPLPDSFFGLRIDVPEFYPGRPYIHRLVEGMDNLNFTDASGDSFPQSPDSASQSPDRINAFFTDANGEQSTANPLYPESASPPENISDELNLLYSDSFVESYVINGIDYCSQTPSPDSHINGFDQYSEPVSNGVIYYTSVATDDHIGNGESFYYNSSPEVLSAGTDNSVENLQVDQLLGACKSPEPPR